MKTIHNWFTEPKYASKIHKYALFGWLVLSIPIAILLSNSIPFIVFLSVYAIVVSHWSSWQAVRTELKQDDADSELKETVQRLRNIDSANEV